MLKSLERFIYKLCYSYSIGKIIIIIIIINELTTTHNKITNQLQIASVWATTNTQILSGVDLIRKKEGLRHEHLHKDEFMQDC